MHFLFKKYLYRERRPFGMEELEHIDFGFPTWKIDKGHNKIVFKCRNASRKYAALYKKNSDIFIKTSPGLLLTG